MEGHANYFGKKWRQLQNNFGIKHKKFSKISQEHELLRWETAISKA